MRAGPLATTASWQLVLVVQTMARIWDQVIAQGPEHQRNGGQHIGWARPYAESPAMFRARLRLLLFTMAPHGWAPSDFAAVAPWAMHLIAGPPDAFLQWWQELTELFDSDSVDPHLSWRSCGTDWPPSGPYGGVRSQTMTASTQTLPGSRLHRAVLALRECIFTGACAPAQLRQHLANLVAAKLFLSIDDAASACMRHPTLLQPAPIEALLQMLIVIRAFEGPVEQAASALEVARQRQLQLPHIVARMMLWKSVRCAPIDAPLLPLARLAVQLRDCCTCVRHARCVQRYCGKHTWPKDS